MTPVDRTPTARFAKDRPGAVPHLRVLDLGRLISAGQCTAVLGDLGADVLKVENPRGGDDLRAVVTKGVPAFWKTLGRNKRSCAIDLKRPEGRATLLDLVAQSDILVENFRPGTLERLEIGPDVLLARQRRLVIVRISGWGQTGPKRDHPGFGTLAEAVSGYMLRNGYADRPPVPAPISVADMVAGLHAAAAALAAYVAAQHSGAGQVVDVSLFEAMFNIMGAEGILSDLDMLPTRGKGTQASSVKGVFACRDGNYVAISAGNDATVERLFAAIGDARLRDERFETYAGRLALQDEVNVILAEWHAVRDRAEVMDCLAGNGVTVAPLYDVDDAADDPHFRAREAILDLPDPEGLLDRIRMNGVVPKLSATPSGIRLPAPRLGEHTREALLSLGYPRERIERLIADGVVLVGEAQNFD